MVHLRAGRRFVLARQEDQIDAPSQGDDVEVAKRFALNPDPVEEGPVGRARVFDPELVAFAEDSRMPARYAFRGDSDVVLFRRAEARVVVQDEIPAGDSARTADEPRHYKLRTSRTIDGG